MIAFSLKPYYTSDMKTSPKQKEKTKLSLKTVLKEIRLLRQDFWLLFPTEDLKEYKHPERIMNAYHNATQQYPPLSL